MSKKTSQDMRIDVHDNLVSIAVGAAQATVPADQIDGIITALRAAQMLVSTAAAFGETPAPISTAARAATPAPAPAPRNPIAPAAEAKAPPATAAPQPAPKRRGRPPKHVGPDGQSLSKRRSRKRVGDALELWLHNNPGWYSEAQLIDLVRREQMTDADPHRALKIALGKQKGTLFETDGDGNWTLISSRKTARAAGAQAKGSAKAAKAAKATATSKTPRGKKAEASAAKSPKPISRVASKTAPKKETAPRSKRASVSRKRQGSSRDSNKSDMEGSPAADKRDESTSKPVRVKKGEKRDEVLQAGRKQDPNPSKRLAESFYASAPERERIRRNLFGDTAD